MNDQIAANITLEVQPPQASIQHFPGSPYVIVQGDGSGSAIDVHLSAHQDPNGTYFTTVYVIVAAADMPFAAGLTPVVRGVFRRHSEAIVRSLNAKYLTITDALAREVAGEVAERLRTLRLMQSAYAPVGRTAHAVAVV